MQIIQKVFLLILIIALPTLSSATVTPIKQKVSTHRLKFKEKAAYWLLKRKIKKARKRGKLPLSFYQNARDTTDCSTIILNSGDLLTVQLLETTETDVTFKYCGKDKQKITLSKSDIYQVVLSDGLVVFDSKKMTATSHGKKSTAPKYGVAILAGIVGVFGLLILGTFPIVAVFFLILALILAFRSHSRHKKKG